MKRITWLIPLVFLALVFSAEGAEDKAGEEKRFALEFYGGAAFIQPEDLNAWGVSYGEYLNYKTENRYRGMQQAPGARIRVRGGINGEFKTMKDMFLSGFRLRYNLGRSFSLSAGCRWMGRQVTSRVTADYEISGILPGGMGFRQDYIRSVEYPAARLYVEGFSPMVGIHYRAFRSRLFNAEVFASAGMVWSSCSMDVLEYDRVNYRDGGDDYWDGADYYNRVDGDGSGISLEAGGRLEYRPAPWLGVFVEGAYGYFKAGDLDGEEILRVRRVDVNASADIQEYVIAGRLGLRRQSAVSDWAAYEVWFPSASGRTNAPYADFALDLSGFRISAGVSLIF